MFDKRLLVLPLALFMLAGCVQEDESVEPSPNPNDASAVGFKASYQPTVGIAPFPNDIYRGSDGTLAPPGVYDPQSAGDAAADFGDPLQAMSTLEGYSTVAPINVYFNDSIDASTLLAGSTVLGFKIADQGNPITPTPFAFEVDVSSAVSAQHIATITPAAPLDPLGTYAFFVTTDVQSTTGANVEADTVFQQIKTAIANGTTLEDAQLEQIKNQAIAPLMQLAGGIGLPADNVAVAWSVTTQPVGPVLQTLEATAAPQDNAFLPLQDAGGIMTTADLNPALQGKADVYVGVMELPYYLDPANPLTSFWQGPNDSFLSAAGGNLMPTPTGTILVPVLLTVPNTSSATGGTINGITIFQHGITQDRTNALAVADALADAGHAVIAIDLPLHGITDTTSPLYASPETPIYAAIASRLSFDVSALTELTFDIDVLNNSTGAAGSDGEIDSSGASFINLSSLLTSRDNLRQGAANLMAVAETVPTMDYNAALDGGASGADFTGLPITYVGHSLGGIVGGTFLGVNADVGPATLGMPGGNISQLLRNSPTFAPRINAGLEAEGLVAGTQLYLDFFRNAQTVVDSGDPINYAAAANANHPIHMIEVVGGAGNLPDQVVPNSATEALSDTMGLACIDAATAPLTGEGIVRFVAGDHGSLLDPSASMAATYEMQSEMAVFMGSGGTTVFDGVNAPTAGASMVIQACP